MRACKADFVLDLGEGGDTNVTARGDARYGNTPRLLVHPRVPSGPQSRRTSQFWHSLAQDLLDARDRVVDRLLGADALDCDAVDRLRPHAFAVDQAVSPVP